jgi:hypothetical protein
VLLKDTRGSSIKVLIYPLLSPYLAFSAAAAAVGRDVYVDIAGWHLFLRDMSAVPGLKMSQALATKLGPEVTHC